MSNGTRFKDILPPEYLQQAKELEKERKRYLQAHEKAWARYATFHQKVAQASLEQASLTQALLEQARLEKVNHEDNKSD